MLNCRLLFKNPDEGSTAWCFIYKISILLSLLCRRKRIKSPVTNSVNAQSAFTLVEIMIVVAIIGVLSALAAISLQKARQHTRSTIVANDFTQLYNAFKLHNMNNISWPTNRSAGVIPSEVRDYLPSRFQWSEPTCLGGTWDWDGPGSEAGLTAGITLVEPDCPRHLFKNIDRILDNGDLSTGDFQENISGKEKSFTYVLEW
ncbi:MAG: type II secretion system protein [Verrucomicrobiota bacterium]